MLDIRSTDHMQWEFALRRFKDALHLARDPSLKLQVLLQRSACYTGMYPLLMH